MATSGNLKMSGLSSVFDERALSRRKTNGQFNDQIHSEKGLGSITPAKKGQKRIF